MLIPIIRLGKYRYKGVVKRFVNQRTGGSNGTEQFANAKGQPSNHAEVMQFVGSMQLCVILEL